MFTGIVEEQGTILVTHTDMDRDNTITIQCKTALEGTRIGDSISVAGVCLTVTHLTEDTFSVGLSPETLRRTNLGVRKVGDKVNLERALTYGGRMGGHYVQGHVDGVGHITDIRYEGESKFITVTPPTEMLKYIVMKGYIAVDGVSLTVAALDDTSFGIAMIAHTQEVVTMGSQQVGEPVNLEVDIIAKYVERISSAWGEHHARIN
ncbi:MAG: riboflavin synthase [Chloroflexi bacterium]|nr:riboflavin synthase [Chloroflexota bacterium]